MTGDCYACGGNGWDKHPVNPDKLWSAENFCKDCRGTGWVPVPWSKLGKNLLD